MKIDPTKAHPYDMTAHVSEIDVEHLVKPCSMCGKPNQGLSDEVVIVCPECFRKWPAEVVFSRAVK